MGKMSDSAREENLLSAIRAANNTKGCICPPGSEDTCRGLDCPRNPPMVQKFFNGELRWVRT